MLYCLSAAWLRSSRPRYIDIVWINRCRQRVSYVKYTAVTGYCINVKNCNRTVHRPRPHQLYTLVTTLNVGHHVTPRSPSARAILTCQVDTSTDCT